VIRIAKCRSRASSFKYGSLAGVFAVYINWCTFLFVLLYRYKDAIPLTEILLNPSGVFHLSSSLSVDGWYSLIGFNVSDWFLWLIWIKEIIGILAAGVLDGSVVLHEKVFCENCNRWVEDIEDEYKIHSSIKNDIGPIAEIPDVQKDKAAHIEVNIHHCSSCNNLSIVDIDLITLEENDKGEIQENEEDFSPVFLITNEQYKKFTDKKL